MELRSLRYFVAVAQTLSFTQAAESLYISQSSLSQQIANLERELGTRLFERTRRTVSLTESGRALFGRAQHILEEVNQLETAASLAGDARYAPQVRIGFEARMIGLKLLPNTVLDCIYHAREHEDNLHARFLILDHDELVQSLENGSLDLAFFMHQKPELSVSDHVAARIIYKDAFAAIVRSPTPPEHTVDGLRAMLMHRGVTLVENEGRGLIQIMRLFEELGIEPPITFAPTRDAMSLTISCGERAGVIPLGIIEELGIPDAQVLSFPGESANLYVIAAWRNEQIHPLVAEIVSTAQRVLEAYAEENPLPERVA